MEINTREGKESWTKLENTLNYMNKAIIDSQQQTSKNPVLDRLRKIIKKN